MPGSSTERIKCGLVIGGLSLFLLASGAAGYYLWRFGPTLFTVEHNVTRVSTPISGGQMQTGRALYVANCAQCHGAQAEGNPVWKTVQPDGTYLPPPHDSSGHTWHHSDRLLSRIIREGGQAVYGANGLESRMPAFGNTLGEDEIAAVLAYFKSLWGATQREFQAAATEQDREG
jgi:mono/diheme cytochrome c family protein